MTEEDKAREVQRNNYNQARVNRERREAAFRSLRYAAQSSSATCSAAGVEILKAMPENQWCPASWLASKVWGEKVTWSARSGQWQKMGVELKRLSAGGYVHMKITESNQKLWRRSLKSPNAEVSEVALLERAKPAEEAE